ncbi:DUF6090 family protein [Aegicerativicinus sediminis]|uniref:DUF6090 family protein n=1 Tax=Aegicerativicinus sediminis TaxID=2893202 RepID=UPI003741EA2E
MENKTSKYLKYAIGEIFLVVIGILIALQINNLNEERKEFNKSKIYRNKIINDLIADTLNVNNLIKFCSEMEMEGEHYFSYFNQGNIEVDKLIDSSNQVNLDFMRYFPVNYTYLDMQSSGNSNLLNDKQKHALFELFETQDQIQIIIEKSIVRTLNQMDLRDKVLGYPDDFYTKIGLVVSKEEKAKWLLHQHLNFSTRLGMYGYIIRFGKTIKEQSKEAILLLKDNSDL